MAISSRNIDNYFNKCVILGVYEKHIFGGK